MTLNAGLIGAGLMGKIHLSKLAEMQKEGLVNVSGICDSDEKKISGEIISAFGLENSETFNDYRKMFSEIGNDMDAVMVATPTSIHYSASKEALKMGINVLVEKPCCETVEQAKSLLKLATDKDACVFSGYQVRFKPPVQHAISLVEDNCLKVHSIRGSMGKYQPRTSTGAHRDLSSHGLDFINMFMGLSGYEKPRSVTGSFSRYAPYMSHEKRESPELSTLSNFDIMNPYGTAVYLLEYGNPEKPGESALASLDSSFDAARRFGELHIRATEPESSDRMDIFINLAEVNYGIPSHEPKNRSADLVYGLFSQSMEYIRAPADGSIDYADSGTFFYPGMEKENEISVKARDEMAEELIRISGKYGIKTNAVVSKGRYDSVYEQDKAFIDSVESGKTVYPLANLDDAILVHEIIRNGEISNKTGKKVYF